MNISKETMIIDEKQASKIMNVAIQTLRNWRHLRKGPAYVKFGRSVRYRVADIESFIDNRRIDPENI